ncbi:Di-copper centre-containing protein [Pseudovirgaria hyperparasitica]|uniref:Di-copper centre-containing protein n=1 Tax=Pseudovirgaria hyperparasitica TaxID=470096 RepID=A0A6A6WC88_9PEZI|nr:Di-copper centre-containing protein [Pseudovirgaria hyperparasitica]KAF2760452.1 Di-copper centre-containing protein [Pseudovirgaria hyperparasitica]
MTRIQPLRVRRDIRKLEADWRRGVEEPSLEGAADLKKPLEDLIRAFKGIQELPPNHPRSYFRITSYHGEPFRGAGRSDARYWGGYCNHGNVLFPVWHRAYLLELENALRSIEGCEQVTLPYWNEVDEVTEKNGLPGVFLMRKFPLDGTEIHNPLFSYKFQARIRNNIQTKPGHSYDKDEGYETVRYPFSGLVGERDRAATTEHNSRMRARGEESTNRALNENVVNWLGGSVRNWVDENVYTGVRLKFERCLEAPNYTVFSNTTSSSKWNEDHFDTSKSSTQRTFDGSETTIAVSLEDPHNGIHLAIGGFEFLGKRNVNAIAGANGDMGENNTASFDPIFFFHHSFIDLLFWQWQKRHDRLDFLDIIDGYAGTTSNDEQGPTAGTPDNAWLNMKFPLQPFKAWKYAPCQGDIPEHMQHRDVMASVERPLQEVEGVLAPSTWNISTGLPPPIPYEWPIRTWPPHSWPPSEWPPSNWPHEVSVTGEDMVNIIKLGYTYEEPPISSAFKSAAQENQNPAVNQPTPVLKVPDVSRAGIAGSFMISTWAHGKLLDLTPVLSRWNVRGCANCLTHLTVRTFVPLHGWTIEDARKTTFTYRIHLREVHNKDRSQRRDTTRNSNFEGKIGFIVNKHHEKLVQSSNATGRLPHTGQRALIRAMF